jgi:copper homeostasis protein
VTSFHVGTAVRPDGSWAAPADAGLVREWRSLVAAAAGS